MVSLQSVLRFAQDAWQQLGRIGSRLDELPLSAAGKRELHDATLFARAELARMQRVCNGPQFIQERASYTTPNRIKREQKSRSTKNHEGTRSLSSSSVALRGPNIKGARS